MWTELHTVPIDSAQQSDALAKIRAGFRSAFADAMR
jgi:hypothetical protein